MKSTPKFKIGDIVKLKSGGPDMTVQDDSNVGETVYWCQWFAGKKLERGRFAPESLELVIPEKKK